MKKKVLLILLITLFLFGCSKKETIRLKNGKKVTITKDVTVDIEYEDYTNGLISLQIPKGWKVEVPKVDYIHYTFKVYNPENPDYMLLFNLKQEGFMKSEKARSWYAKHYPTSAYGKIAPISPQNTEAFFKAWSKNAKFANSNDFKSEFFPYYNEFNVIEKLDKLPLGGDLLRATYKNSKGEIIQGLFTATVYNPGKYVMYGIDFAPLSVYHIITMTAPDAEFNNWQKIYDHCIGTLVFTDQFMNGFGKEEAQLVKTIKANQKIYDSISDMIVDSWNKRSNSYDIISQKQSDATLGYERVYNTNTNEVYRAYNGFTGDYQGNEYKIATDDMYTKPIYGYIEK